MHRRRIMSGSIGATYELDNENKAVVVGADAADDATLIMSAESCPTKAIFLYDKSGQADIIRSERRIEFLYGYPKIQVCNSREVAAGISRLKRLDKRTPREPWQFLSDEAYPMYSR